MTLEVLTMADLITKKIRWQNYFRINLTTWPSFKHHEILYCRSILLEAYEHCVSRAVNPTPEAFGLIGNQFWEQSVSLIASWEKKRQWHFWHIYWCWQHCNVLSIQDGGMTMLNKGSVVLRIPIHLMYFITLTRDEHRNDICDARSELLLSLHGWYVFLNKCFLDSFCPRGICVNISKEKCNSAWKVQGREEIKWPHYFTPLS